MVALHTPPKALGVIDLCLKSSNPTRCLQPVNPQRQSGVYQPVQRWEGLIAHNRAHLNNGRVAFAVKRNHVA
jgi:hypothetical protein|tara:strand:- start:1328 stop:1543 length:216 start_codon:yes stop_codon:yes gene_type:complete